MALGSEMQGLGLGLVLCLETWSFGLGLVYTSLDYITAPKWRGTGSLWG